MIRAQAPKLPAVRKARGDGKAAMDAVTQEQSDRLKSAECGGRVALARANYFNFPANVPTSRKELT